MNGMERFEYYLKQVEELTAKAEAQENPGLWLFTNDLRTRMFMLEALAKLHSKLHDKNTFEKLQEHFKELEDVLGDIDYYNEYENEYKDNPTVAPEILAYFRQKKENHIGELNVILVENKWIQNDKPRIEKIRKKLSEVEWLSEEEEIIAIKKYYRKAIESIKEFYDSIKGKFTKMEEQVHELRRKIRWLSIYPQALRGSIQFSDDSTLEPYMEKYLVPEIVNSPFNKLPQATDQRHFLRIKKNHFLALSWLIAELGKLKDTGLGIIILQEAIKESEVQNAENLPTEVLQSKPSLEELLQRASDISKVFFDEGHPEKLVE